MTNSLSPDLLLQLLVVFEGLSAWKVSPLATHKLASKSDISDLDAVFQKTEGSVLEKSQAVVEQDKKRKVLERIQANMRKLSFCVTWSRRMSILLGMAAPVGVLWLWLFDQFEINFPLIIFSALAYMCFKIVFFVIVFILGFRYNRKLKIVSPSTTNGKNEWDAGTV